MRRRSAGCRFDSLEPIAFKIDGLEEQIAVVEQKPPTPLGGPELVRQRDEHVLRVRADGFSFSPIAAATGVSRATVRRMLLRQGDPAPARVSTTGGGTYPAHPSPRGGSQSPIRSMLGMEPRFVHFRAENAINAQTLAQKIDLCVYAVPEPHYADLIEWCEDFNHLVGEPEPIPAWADPSAAERSSDDAER